ncbi:MAG: AzlC family ABC transporter permease [Tissierellia bacterium]|nr:AzlC family ABC transporter permease [Tissierellia bacterium]
MEKRNLFIKGLKDAIPVGIGYLAVSFSLGIAAKNAGLTGVEALIMSFTNNTSAGEFAALGIIASGGSYLEMAMSQLIINLRYLLMSASLSQKIERGTGLLPRLIMGYEVTDEVFALSMGVKGRLSPYYTYGLMCTAIPGWSLGTYLGVVVGNILSPRLLISLSIALYAMFIAIIIPPTREHHFLGKIILLSMFSSLVFHFLPLIKELDGGMRMIILTIGISFLAAKLGPVKEINDE